MALKGLNDYLIFVKNIFIVFTSKSYKNFVV